MLELQILEERLTDAVGPVVGLVVSDVVLVGGSVLPPAFQVS